MINLKKVAIITCENEWGPRSGRYGCTESATFERDLFWSSDDYFHEVALRHFQLNGWMIKPETLCPYCAQGRPDDEQGDLK